MDSLDINTLRSAVTTLGLLLFIGLVAWTWRPARKAGQDLAARLPFDGDAASEERAP